MIVHTPVLPLNGTRLADCWEIVGSILPGHGFEPMVTFTAIDVRTVYAVITIVFDRDVAGEDERAAECFGVLAADLADAGMFPYRLGLQGAELPSFHDEGHRDLVRLLKRTLDPGGILNPGKLFL